MAETSDKVPFIDLFAGTGAFSLAFEETKRFECVYANDIEPASKAMYEANFPDHEFELGDILDVEPEEMPEHELLCAGFPCQPFSVAGERKGFDDPRSNVFWRIIDILETHAPNYIILENVKNLKTHDKGNTYKVIKEALEKQGYFLRDQVLDTCEVTPLPQHRERIYIVGFRDKEKGQAFSFDFPKVSRHPISSFLEKNIDDSYYYTDRYSAYAQIEKEVTKSVSDNAMYQYRRYYVRENKSGCCPALTANMGTGGHNVPLLRDKKGIRKLTPRECFNLQGFPESFQLPELADNALYKLSGNAVSIPVVRLIANALTKLL